MVIPGISVTSNGVDSTVKRSIQEQPVTYNMTARQWPWLLSAGFGVAALATISMWAGGGRSPTQAYIDAFTPARYELSGSDSLNERYSPKRIGKPLDQIDDVKDYDFELLAKVSGRLADVDRRQALKAIFEKITSGARTEIEREVKLLEFLHQSGYHNIFVQPMYEDGQAVFDPLVLLELGEMRCGQVARIASDLYEAAGYRTRLVQAAEHVSAEVFYNGGWHILEADLSGGGQTILVDGSVPSIGDLTQQPALLDRLPSRHEIGVYMDPIRGRLASKPYPSYYFFSKWAYGELRPQFYYKTASPDQAASSKWYGWNYYRTEIDTTRELLDLKASYEPGAPRLESVRVTAGKARVTWSSSRDEDGDLLGYRVYVSSRSRGWNYPNFSGSDDAKRFWKGGWRPEMYAALFREPFSDVALIETKDLSVTIDLPAGQRRYVSILPFDKHGEGVGRRLYLASEELSIGSE
jgi:hypothetical protein